MANEMTDEREIDPPTNLGVCCTCGTSEGVTNIVMLDQRAPKPGFGWGCVVCDLPPDGAVAVLCDACIGQPISNVCYGYPVENARVALEDLPFVEFKHDPAKHVEHDAA